MASQKIAIVCDSSCDIPQDLRQQYNIYVTPMYINMEKVLRDGVDIAPEEFYDYLVSHPKYFPTTSQSNPEDFLQVYQRAKAEGAEEIVTLVLSSAMSGAIQSAQNASGNIDIPVHVYDSKTNSMGLGWQVLAAARAREIGENALKMLDAANEVRKRLAYFITLDTVDYLYHGGRIGTATAFIGQLLHIKPIIKVNHETGSVEAGLPARTRKRSIEAVFEQFFKQMDTSLPLHIAVLHNNAYDEAAALAERVKNEFHPVEMLTTIVSPLLGVHTGPKAVALCGYTM